jgi:serine/threonine protein kinase
MPAELIAQKYRIVREIARSNDIVYEAVDVTRGLRVAVKELNLPQNLTGQAKRDRIDRFIREARAVGKLSHPNIVTVYDFGEDMGRYYIAMEYLEGGTLRDLMQSRGTLSLPEALDIACQVLSALGHAHSRKVVHRDVKPDNIHILPGGQVKLTDFGIARMTEEMSLTVDGQVFGTPSYMSPEQIEGRFIDLRSDLFSLAIVLYEMLAGRKPFIGDSVVSITYNIMHSDPPPLPGVPFGVERVIFRALSKDPSRRYASAEEMRRELQDPDAVPSIFLPPAPQIGRGGFSYGGGAALPATGGGAPANLPPSPYPSGSWMPGGATPQGGYMGAAMPPTGNVFPAPNRMPAAQPAMPFVNWNAPNPGAVPPAAMPPAPPYPRQPAGPLIGEGARTFFSLMFLTILISGLVVGFALLFFRAYEQRQKQGALYVVQQTIEEGNRLFQWGRYQEAAERFRMAADAGAGAEAGIVARNNLAIVYNQMGVQAFDRNDWKAAEDYFHRALDANPGNPDARANLAKLYDRMGDRERAGRIWQSGEGGRIGNENPASPGSTVTLQQRIERSKQYYEQAEQAFRSNDYASARDLWLKASGEAPGTEWSNLAKERLNALSQYNIDRYDPARGLGDGL